jgi:Acetoacetate decarboxylase (ADC)
MVLTGTRNIADLLARAPTLDNFDAEAWEIAGVELLHLRYEIDDANRESLLPRALHPTIPATAIFTAARYPDSPVGPFMLAQVRVACRSAALPRGFLLRAYTDSAAASDALARRWGYACDLGEVKLARFHDRIVATVKKDGSGILQAALIDPEPISGGDVQYVANMNLVRQPDGPAALVQVDPEYRFHRAERGRCELTTFDRAAWSAEGVDPVYPIVASFTQCDTGFPAIRFVLDPDKTAIEGTRKIR